MEVARKSSLRTKEIKEGVKSMEMFQLFESILLGDKSKIQENVKKLKESESMLTTKDKINLNLAQFELTGDINQFFNNTSNSHSKRYCGPYSVHKATGRARLSPI